MVCAIELPPNLSEHIRSSQRPDEYYYFWAFGGLCLIIIGLFLIPKFIEIWKAAKCIRNEDGLILMPFSHITCELIILFPLFAAIGKYFVFISPITTYTQEFAITSYQAFTLYCFSRLLVMFLGSNSSLNKAMNTLKDSPPTQFWTVFPLCCFKPICKAKTMTKQDFRNIHYLILQYAFLAPLITFCQVLRFFEGSATAVLLIRTIKVLSSFVCLYALLALMTASSEMLKNMNIKAKFWCIKGIMFTMILPPMIMGLVSHIPGQNQVYSNEIMGQAWSAMISIIVFTILSFGFYKFWGANDALKAYRNATTSKIHNVSCITCLNDDNDCDNVTISLHSK